MQDPGVDFVGCSRKRRRRSPERVSIHIRNFGTPLISGSSGLPLDTVPIETDRPFTIGRSNGLCDFVFDHVTVSRKHCQILFDSRTRKLYILDGVITSNCASFGPVVDEFRRRLNDVDELEKENDDLGVLETRASLNGLFVNRVRVRRGKVQEVFAGDEVSFVCGNEGLCNKQVQIGFLVQGVAYEGMDVSASKDRHSLIEAAASSGHSRGTLSSGKRGKRVYALRENEINSPVSGFSALKHVDIFQRMDFLLSHCRHILRSKDPISCLRLSGISDECQYCCRAELLGSEVDLVAKNSESFEPVLEKETVQYGLSAGNKCPRPVVCKSTAPEFSNPIGEMGNCVDSVVNDKTNAMISNYGKKENTPFVDHVDKDKVHEHSFPTPGKNFFLNRLQFMVQSSHDCQRVVSLPELLHPVGNILQVFIATFTSDIPWFLSCCEIPCHLPVTVACHNAERCWSSGPDARTTAPYPDYPNLTVVFPPFPEEIAFGKDRKKHGIACHHPKLFILQREDSVRVVITSANLVSRQWNDVTNTVWWQDFCRRREPNVLSLFTQHGGETSQGLSSDFGAQLAGFVASLLIDVPSQAHWIIELTKYNFEGAAGYLVASVPGIHSYRSSHLSESVCFKPTHHHISESWNRELLGSIEASVVGLSYLFHAANDSRGAQLKKLASFLRKSRENSLGMLEIVLRRNTNIPADANAVSILVPDPDDNSRNDCVQLGFLPRNIAKWVSPLWDMGFFEFVGYVFCDEVLGAASRRSNQKVQLMLHVLQAWYLVTCSQAWLHNRLWQLNSSSTLDMFEGDIHRLLQGPSVSDIAKLIQPLHVVALCSLVVSLQRCTGIWRLEEVLGRYKWPESQECDFIYGSSSIGCSANAEFVAAFSSAAGKKVLQQFDSQESDPEWGCWSATEEQKAPSIRIIFPTIERVKNAHDGVLSSKRVLCFSEKTWQRLRGINILHDAVPHPCDRVGHPMHVKVARRRFSFRTGSPSSCGWVYCGSHNFSAAAWGQRVSRSSRNKEDESYNALKSSSSSLSDFIKLRVCNYELGIIFVFPPPPEGTNSGSRKGPGLDDVTLPFLVPAPRYGPNDRPATGLAMREALLSELTKQSRRFRQEMGATEEEVVEEDEDDEAGGTGEFVPEEKDDEKAYAEALWSQVDSCPRR